MKLFVAILALLLAACSPREAPRPAPVMPATPPVDVTPGFNEKEPDTCKAAGLQGLIGQPSGMLRTVALAGPLRVVGPNEVVDQEEYRSTRVDAYVDGAGVIARLSCG